MKNNENQRVRLTKTLLKNSLIELMRSKSVHKVTIKELCENAGINRSTFYLYYKDQFALLHDIEEDLLHHVRRHLEKIDSNSGNFHYLQELLAYIKDNSEVFSILLSRLDNLTFQTSFIGEAITALKVKLDLNSPEHISGYIYRYLIMGSLSIINKWMEDGFDLTVEELSDMIFQLSDSAVSVYSRQ
ncbi:hypothetical protein D3C75_169140 [compost metagenome]